MNGRVLIQMMSCGVGGGRMFDRLVLGMVIVGIVGVAVVSMLVRRW